MLTTGALPRLEWGGVSTKSDEVEAFFQRNPSFVCPKLHARILRLYCLQRMIAPNPKTGAQGYLKGDTPFNAFCRSGECEEGLCTIQILGVEDEYEEFLQEQPKGKKCTTLKNQGESRTTTKRRKS